MDSFAREQEKKLHEGLEELKEEMVTKAMISFIKVAGEKGGAEADVKEVEGLPVQEEVKVDVVGKDESKTGIKQNA